MYEATQTDVVLSSLEHRQMLHGLIYFRNKLIYTDAVDELLIKLEKAKRCHHG